jgi:hypothetical protein
MTFTKLAVLSISLIISSLSLADTAAFKVAELSCKDTSSSLLLFGQSRWESTSTSGIYGKRANTSDSLCKAIDTQAFINSLQSACTTYFDIVSITPITKGFGQLSYYDVAFNGTYDNGRSPSYGYGYTDRMILTYKCL